MSDILVIPDSHCKPGVSNRRFEWLGNLAAERQPDVIVHLGDWFDMESLSSYDKGKASFHGRNYKDDIDAGLEAADLLMRPLRARKKKLPRRIFCEGNHEERYHRLLQYEPQLKGELRQPCPSGWEYVPFLKPAVIEGIYFQHYFVSGLMGRPLGGEHPSASILKQQMVSAVCGHSHIFDYSERTRADGKKIRAITGGCFLDEDQHESYAQATEHLWHNGIFYLWDCSEGDYDLEVISYERLKKSWK